MFKTKWISQLGNYTPKNHREKQLISFVIDFKLQHLNWHGLNSLAYDLWRIINYEKDISLDFRHLCKDMLKDLGNIHFEKRVVKKSMKQ